MRVTLLDHGAGNLHSLAKAIARTGAAVAIESDPRSALDTDALVLPGVGAFAAAAARLAPARAELRAALDDGLPCLGICLGMQLLFERSEEGPGAGLGAIAGIVTRLRARQVPHIGWNAIEGPADPVLERASVTTAYFANSYVCRPEEEACVVAWSTHEGDRFAAAVRKGRTLGLQFHPEKSSAPGLALIAAFLGEVGA